MSIEYNENSPGIEFSELAKYNEVEFSHEFDEFVVGRYPNYLHDRERFLDIRYKNTVMTLEERNFMQKFLSKEMSAQIAFFGNFYKRLDPKEFPDRANQFSKKALNLLAQIKQKHVRDKSKDWHDMNHFEKILDNKNRKEVLKNKKEVTETLKMLKELYIEMRRLGLSHEGLTS